VITRSCFYICSDTYSGPEPFKYFDYWQNCEGFQNLVKTLRDKQIAGHTMYQVAMKLKKLKPGIKDWLKANGISKKQNIASIRDPT